MKRFANLSYVIKRTAAVAFLVLMAAGPASVWADALECCPPEQHGVTLHAADGCPTPVCCMANAPVPARKSETEQVSAATTVTTPVAVTRVTGRTSNPDSWRAGDSSPAHAQTSPVLRR